MLGVAGYPQVFARVFRSNSEGASGCALRLRIVSLVGSSLWLKPGTDPASRHSGICACVGHFQACVDDGHLHKCYQKTVGPNEAVPQTPNPKPR